MFKKASSPTGQHDPDLLVGLDLGTSKITVVIAEMEGRTSEAQIIGMGQAPSSGIRKGLIVNLDQAVRSVKQAIGDAQNMVGLEFDEATVAFSGSDVTSIRSKGMVSLGRTPRPVMQLDVERVIEAAQTEVSVPANQSVLHTIPVEYSLDGHGGIDDPLGMTGMRLEIDLQSVIVPTAVLQNVLNCVEKAGLEVTGLVIKPLASAMGCLSPEEAMAGAVSVDIGGGTCGVAVFADGRPKRIAVIPVGGDHITNDVACVLKIPLSKAEEVKREVSLLDDAGALGTTIDFEIRGRSYSCSVSDISEIIKCRVEELFTILIKNEITESGSSMLPAGIVISGGVARTNHIDSYISDIMDIQARVAYPLDSSKMPPGRNGYEQTCAAGIIRYMVERERNPLKFMEPSLEQIKRQSRVLINPEDRGRAQQPQAAAKQAKPSGEGMGRLFDSVKRSFKELF